MTKIDDTAPIREYIEAMLPWAHGHQIKGLTDYVIAILDRQTGNQADLVRELGNQEAALKRLSRLNYNERLSPRKLADSVLAQAIAQLPNQGKVRLAMDWTIEAEQYLLTISLVIRGRGRAHLLACLYRRSVERPHADLRSRDVQTGVDTGRTANPLEPVASDRRSRLCRCRIDGFAGFLRDFLCYSRACQHQSFCPRRVANPCKPCAL